MSKRTRRLKNKQKKEEEDYKKGCTVTVYQSENKIWDSDLEDEFCPAFNDKVKANIFIPQNIWNSIQKLTEDIDSEWLGYFRGNYVPEELSLYVDELVVPTQEVTGVSVVVKQDVARTEGVVHSHNNMSAFFSGTDDTFINSNNSFTLVVNKRGEHKARARLKLDCGKYISTDCGVKILRKVSDNFIEKAKKRIIEKKITYNSSYKSYQSSDLYSYEGSGYNNYYKKNDNRSLESSGFSKDEEQKTFEFLDSHNKEMWSEE